MIVIDTSAIIAIARGESDAAPIAACIGRDDAPQISAVSVLECSIVLRSFRELPSQLMEDRLDRLLDEVGLAIQPVDGEQLALARRAHLTYGKGTGHPARLNFGDCFSYALARRLNVPLLYKGDDFIHTDVAAAL